MQLALADSAAALGRRCLPAMHQRVRANVRQLLGPSASEQQVEALARAQWRNYLRYLRDFVALPHEGCAALQAAFQAAEGRHYLDDALAAGKGAILASAHFGNWDRAAGMVAAHYPVNVIADSFTSAKLDRLVTEYRNALNVKVIPVDKALKRTLSALRRNEMVAFLIDKPLPGDQGVTVSFFGQPAQLPAGAAFFASRTGAPILPAFCWKLPSGEYRARAFPPISVPASAGRQADLAAAMQQVAGRVETMIRQYPEQWFMFRRMWAPTEEMRETRSAPLEVSPGRNAVAYAHAAVES